MATSGVGERAARLAADPQAVDQVLGPLPDLSNVSPSDKKALLGDIGLRYAAATAVVGNHFSRGMLTTTKRITPSWGEDLRIAGWAGAKLCFHPEESARQLELVRWIMDAVGLEHLTRLEQLMKSAKYAPLWRYFSEGAQAVSYLKGDIDSPVGIENYGLLRLEAGLVTGLDRACEILSVTDRKVRAEVPKSDQGTVLEALEGDMVRMAMRLASLPNMAAPSLVYALAGDWKSVPAAIRFYDEKFFNLDSTSPSPSLKFAKPWRSFVDPWDETRTIGEMEPSDVSIGAGCPMNHLGTNDRFIRATVQAAYRSLWNDLQPGRIGVSSPTP